MDKLPRACSPISRLDVPFFGSWSRVCCRSSFFLPLLNEKKVLGEQEQQWALRIGTGLAFMVKVALVASVGLAYTQRLWLTVGKRSITLQDLDDAFSLTTSPFSFFSGPVLRKAKVLCVLAICTWIIPLVALITPATLSVRTGILHSSEPTSVPFPIWVNETRDAYKRNFWVNSGSDGRATGPSYAF